MQLEIASDENRLRYQQQQQPHHARNVGVLIGFSHWQLKFSIQSHSHSCEMSQRALHVTVSTRLLSVSLLLVYLMPGGSGQAMSRLGAPPGPFNSTAWFPSLGNLPGRKCGGTSFAILLSADRNYTLEHSLACPNESAILCWAGVRPRFSSLDIRRGPLSDNPLADLKWHVSIELNQQPTNSCALRFTEDGDLQFGIGPPIDLKTLDPGVDGPISVVWSSKTSGLGAVEIVLGNDGILNLHDANSSVVWQSLEGSTDTGRITDSSSRANVVKRGLRYLAGILLFLVLYS